MNYKGEITIEFNGMAKSGEDAESLYKTLLPEIIQSKKNRSEFRIDKVTGKLRITFVAQDSVALRATLNNITKLLTVYEKM